MQQQQHGQAMGIPPGQLTHANMAALYAQDPRLLQLRFGAASNAAPNMNAHLAQSVPARSSPLAQYNPQIQRPSPHISHMLPQQAAQRGMPLTNAPPVTARSPAPNGSMAGHQEAAQPPSQPPATPAPNLHPALLAQYGAGPNSVNLTAGRGMLHAPNAQMQRQSLTPQQQQQLMQSGPYPPSLNLGQLQQLTGWRLNNQGGQTAIATAHLGRGQPPPNMQQYLQNGQLPPQMVAGRGMGGKRPSGR
jgi:hypothetical protein